MVAGNVSADPATDALARLNELSRTAEQTTEAMHSAQLDLDAKLAAQKKDAEDRKAADEAALEAAKAELIKYQGASTRSRRRCTWVVARTGGYRRCSPPILRSS